MAKNNYWDIALIGASLLGLYYLVSTDVKNAVGGLKDAFKIPSGTSFFDITPDLNNIRDEFLKLLPQMPGTTQPVTAVHATTGGTITHTGYPDIQTQPGDFIDPSLIRSGAWTPTAPTDLTTAGNMLKSGSGLSTLGMSMSPPSPPSPSYSYSAPTPIITNQYGESSSGGTYPTGSFRGKGGIVD